MKKIRIFMLAIATLLSTIVFAQRTITNAEITKLYKDLPFKMVKLKVPKIPKRSVSITDFGAIGDGLTLNTEAFSKAIDAVSVKGGGTVVVPQGLWFTGPIVFKSNINLHLEKGALILFSPDFDLYPIVDTSFEGLDTKRCQSPISGRNLQNISITGEGVIDGNGQAWRFVKKSKLTANQWKKLVASGGVLNEKKNEWWPSESALRGSKMAVDQNTPDPRNVTNWDEIRDYLRPVLVSFISCKNILLDGVTFQNSPAWNIHPLMCENVIIANITVRNPWYSQNGDGLDLESCKNAIVYNSSFDVGDDAICVKSGKNEDGRRRGIPCENIIVSKCVVYHGHGGFVVGSEMSGGVKNVSVNNCLFMGTDVGLRFKSTRGRGGVVENIYISDINMIDIPTDPLLFDLFYGGKSALEALADGDTPDLREMLVTIETPSFKDIYIKNINSRGSMRAMYFNGLPEMNVKNVNVENSFFEAKEGAVLAESDGVVLKNVTIDAAKGPMVSLTNTKNVRLHKVKSSKGNNDLVSIKGKKTKNIQLKEFLSPQNLVIDASVNVSEISVK
jgi:polygalacturonase